MGAPFRLLLLVTLIGACGGPRQATGPTVATSRPSGPPSPPRAGAPRVGNQDPSSVEDQPDYDGQAELLRLRLEDRVRRPPPAAKACARMMAAVRAHYRRTPAPPAARARMEAALAATASRDEAACRRETSPRAALCVALMLEDGGADELDWALDQCARAFPREGPRSGG